MPHPQCNSELPHSRPSFRWFEEFGFLLVSNPARWSLSCFTMRPLHWLSSYLQDLQQKSVFSFYPLELTCCKLLSPLSLLLLFSTKRGGGDPADINIGPCGVSRGQSWVPCSINVVRTHTLCKHYQPVVIEYLTVDTASVLLLSRAVSVDKSVHYCTICNYNVGWRTLVLQMDVVLCRLWLWYCVAFGSLLLSILGPAWRQSRTTGRGRQPATSYWFSRWGRGR